MTLEILTEAEATRLLKLEKHPANDNPLIFPDFGGKMSIELINPNEKEEFIINYNRGSINLEKRNHQIRTHSVIVLARLDLYGPTHRNPDGTEIGPCHLHIYKEGFGVKWAYDVPENILKTYDNAFDTLIEFMNFCNVKNPPQINRTLFS